MAKAMSKQEENDREIADRIQAVLTRRNEDGTYCYEKEDCRDFLGACVFGFGLDVDGDLAGPLLRFMSKISVDVDADVKATALAVEKYFESHPLHPDLLHELDALAKEVVLEDVDRFRGRATELMALAAAGSRTEKHAPPHFEEEPLLPVKPRRGLVKKIAV